MIQLNICVAGLIFALYMCVCCLMRVRAAPFTVNAALHKLLSLNMCGASQTPSLYIVVRLVYYNDLLGTQRAPFHQIVR